MNYIFLDLEWNNAYSKKLSKFINEIIEIGAVKLDANLNVISTFDKIIKSQITKRLGSRFKNLTHITNTEMHEGVPFSTAIDEFLNWCGEDFVLVTWSNSDLYAIAENFNSFLKLNPADCFGLYLDLQKFYQSICPSKDGNQISLKDAADNLGLSTDNIEFHRALDDSVLTSQIFKKINTLGDYSKLLVNTKTKNFYARLLFHPYLIVDINDPNIDAEDFILFCENCGKHLKPIYEWKSVNKQFVNRLKCTNCKSIYKGCVRIKKYFDHTTVKKRAMPFTPRVSAKTGDNR